MNYVIPENPQYDENVRALQNSDPANAETVFNPTLQQMVINTAAVKLDMERRTDRLRPIIAEVDPTPSTHGAVSQIYINTVNNLIFVCTDATSGTYKWLRIGGLLPQILVSAPTGATVTCTDGVITFSATAKDELAIFTVPLFGYWTITSEYEGQTRTTYVAVNAVRQFEVNLLAKIFGVEWDYASTSTRLTRLTRHTDPSGLVTVDITTEPVSEIAGTRAGSSPFDEHYPWCEMDEYNVINNLLSFRRGEPGFSRTANDVVVSIPKFWYRIELDVDNQKWRLYISDVERPGFTMNESSNRGDGKVRDFSYVGKYNTTTGYNSRSAVAHVVSMTRATARTQSANKGAPWWQYDFAAWTSIWMLYLVEYADWDSQTCVGRGRVDGNSAQINSGGTDAMAYHTGRAAGTAGQVSVMYRWIENLWGNVWDFCDGINFNNRRIWICLNPQNFADDTSVNYFDIGHELAVSGWPTQLGLSATMPSAYVPIAVGGSETTRIPDHMWSNTGWTILLLGGAWSNAGNAGLFCFHASYASSYANTSIGSRLLYLP